MITACVRFPLRVPRRFKPLLATSAPPRTTDIVAVGRHVSKVPTPQHGNAVSVSTVVVNGVALPPYAHLQAYSTNKP